MHIEMRPHREVKVWFMEYGATFLYDNQVWIKNDTKEYATNLSSGAYRYFHGSDTGEIREFKVVEV